MNDKRNVSGRGSGKTSKSRMRTIERGQGHSVGAVKIIMKIERRLQLELRGICY